MPSIFVSFRKVDNRWMRDRVYQALVEAFGAAEIFKSGESIPAGADFGTILRRQAAESKIMLVLIGAGWIEGLDSEGGRLLDREDDWVRMEITTAFRAGNRVIPVLLGDSAMLPSRAALPPDIAVLGQTQFVRIHDAHLEDGLQGLVAAVSELLPEPPLAQGAATSEVDQNAGGGSAVSISGKVRNARIAGGDIRQTRIYSGGVLSHMAAVVVHPILLRFALIGVIIGAVVQLNPDLPRWVWITALAGSTGVAVAGLTLRARPRHRQAVNTVTQDIHPIIDLPDPALQGTAALSDGLDRLFRALGPPARVGSTSQDDGGRR